jgi:hypothetical protein
MELCFEMGMLNVLCQAGVTHFSFSTVCSVTALDNIHSLECGITPTCEYTIVCTILYKAC